MMGWQWHQLNHIQIICTSLQTDNHASTSSLRVFYRPDALPAAQPTASKHWRHKYCFLYCEVLCSAYAYNCLPLCLLYVTRGRCSVLLWRHYIQYCVSMYITSTVRCYALPVLWILHMQEVCWSSATKGWLNMHTDIHAFTHENGKSVNCTSTYENWIRKWQWDECILKTGCLRAK